MFDLTITGGITPVNQDYGAGAILIFDSPGLELDHVVVRDNLATDSATFNHRDGAAINLQLTPGTIRDSEIRDNVGMGGVSATYDRVDVSRTTITGNSYPDGLAAAIRGRTVEISDSTISDNSVTGGSRGDLGTGGVLAGPLTVRRSTFERNHGTGSGAIASGEGLIEDSTFEGNSSKTDGGALLLNGTLRRSSIRDNTALTGGGGFFEGVIEDSTISGNSAPTGGGIAFGVLTVRRSTVEGNTAEIGAGMAPRANSGSPPPSLHLEDATIAGNVASGIGPGALPAEISLVSGATSVPASVESSRSVVGDGTIPACSSPQPNVALHGYNFWSDSSCIATVSGVDITNGGDPRLGPLQDNGGPTQTRLPLPGSPLRDRIPLSNAGCAGEDQRGVSRPQGLGCDIGATEVEVPPSGFVGMAPKRILDTRTAPVPAGWSAGTKLGSGGELDLTVAGANGVPADATAVVLNVTSTEATSALSYVATWPAGQLPPSTSSLNLQPNANVANSITVAPGVDGEVSFATNTGATHLVVDVLGYYVPTGGDRFTSVTPVRMLDTRYGPVPTGRAVGQKLSGPGTIRLPVAGVNGVPADVTAVVVNITSTQVTSDLAFLTAWPAGQARPTASNLNLQPPYNVSNLAFVKLGTGGAIDLYTNTGSTHLIVDVVGYFRPSTGDRFLPLNPARVFNSLAGTPLMTGVARFATVVGVSGIPANATSVVLNATSAAASSPGGYLIVFGKGAVLSNETGSNLNYRPPYNAPNQVIAPVGDDQSVGMENGFGTVHIILDANGYFVSVP